jgi:hypothetical protein
MNLAALEQVEDVFGGHQLGEAGRVDQLIGVALEQHAAAFCFDQDGVRRADIGLVFLDLFPLRQRGRGQQRQAGSRRQHPCEPKTPNSHHQWSLAGRAAIARALSTRNNLAVWRNFAALTRPQPVLISLVFLSLCPISNQWRTANASNAKPRPRP